jgi:hypothetical protein
MVNNSHLTVGWAKRWRRAALLRVPDSFELSMIAWQFSPGSRGGWYGEVVERKAFGRSRPIQRIEMISVDKKHPHMLGLGLV